MSQIISLGSTNYWPFALLSQSLVFSIVIVCAGLIGNLQWRYGALWTNGQVWTSLDSDPLMSSPYLQGPYTDVVTGFLAFAGALLMIVLIAVLVNLACHPAVRPSAMSTKYAMTMLTVLLGIVACTLTLWELASFGTDLVSVTLLTPVVAATDAVPAIPSHPSPKSQLGGPLGDAVTGVNIAAGSLAFISLIMEINNWPTLMSMPSKSRRKRADGFDVDGPEDAAVSM